MSTAKGNSKSKSAPPRAASAAHEALGYRPRSEGTEVPRAIGRIEPLQTLSTA